MLGNQWFAAPALSSSTAIRARMSKISWRTSVAHLPMEDTTRHAVSGTRLGQISTGTQGTRSQAAAVPRRPRRVPLERSGLLTRASAAPAGGGVLTDSVLSSGVIGASPEVLAVNMLLAAWYR